MTLAQSLAALVVDAALGVWLGAVVFFSFVAAPRVFAVLSEDRAGRVVNDVFPRYYVFGLALGGVALAAGVAAGALSGFDPAALALLAAVAVALACNAYARYVLIPRMDEAGDDAFQRYHRQSVVLNGVAMLGIAVGLVASHL